MTGNPYVDEVESESNPYLEPESEAKPVMPPKLTGYELARWNQIQKGQLEPMGIWGPIQPPEEYLQGPNIWTGLGALAKGAQAVTAPVFQAAEDITAEALRGYGVDAYPGVPLVETGPYPITAGGPLGLLLRQVSPETAAAIDRTSGEIISGFTTPGNITLGAAPVVKPALAKPIQGLFAAGMAGNIPESAQAFSEAETLPEKTAAGMRAGTEIAMAYFLGKHMGQNRTVRERIRDASQVSKTAEVYGDVRPQPIEGEGQMPIEESGAGVRPEAQGDAQVLLDTAIANNRSLGLGHELRLVDSLDKDSITVFDSTPAKVDADGNFVAPGQIRVSLKAFDRWMQDMTSQGLKGEDLQNALNSLFAEEGLHSITTPNEAAAYLQSLTSVERAIGKRRYLGNVKAEQIGFNDNLLGYELLRQRMQRLLNMDPTEIAELAGMERWSVRSLEFIQDLIRRFREFIGTNAAKAGSRITADMLDRAQSNLDIAKEVSDSGVPLGGEQPFGLRRYPREEVDDRITTMRDADMVGFHRELADSSLTEDAWNLGYSVHTPEQLEGLTQANAKARSQFSDALKRKDMKQAALEAFRGQYFREAYEAATGTASAGRALQGEPGYKPPFPEGQYPQAPEGVEQSTFEKGIRVEAKDHPEVAAKHPELLPQLVKDELKLDKKAYQKDADPGTGAPVSKEMGAITSSQPVVQVRPGVTMSEGPGIMTIRRRFHGTPHKLEPWREYELPDGKRVKVYGNQPAPADGKLTRKGSFTTDRMGTGEGAQVYGWGLYFAEERKVSEEYAERLSEQDNIPSYVIDGEVIPWNGRYNLRYDAAEMIHSYGWRGALDSLQRELVRMERVAPMIGDLQKELGGTRSIGEDITYHKKLIELLEGDFRYKQARIKENKGNLYEVEFDIEESDLIDGDKPLREQPELVAKLIKNGILKEDTETHVVRPDFTQEQLFAQESGEVPDAERPGGWSEKVYEVVGSDGNYIITSEATGQDLYENLVAATHDSLPETTFRNAPKAVSQFLASELGIKGIRYLDQNSRIKADLDVPALERQLARDKENLARYEQMGMNSRFVNDQRANIRFLEAQIRNAKGPRTSNYVIFDEDVIRTIKENDQPYAMGIRRKGKPSPNEMEFAFGDLFTKKPEKELPPGATPPPEKLSLPLGGTPELGLQVPKAEVKGAEKIEGVMPHLGQQNLPKWKPAPGKALPEGSGFDFESRRKTVAETQKIPAGTVEQQLDQYLSTAKKPKFSEAVRSIPGAQAAHMREAWLGSVWRTLENMPGEQLMKLRDQLNLGRQVGTGKIADAAQIEKGKTRMTPAQQYRNRTIAEIGSTLIEQAYKNSAKGWSRKTVEPEEVGFWRQKNSKQAAVRKVTAADRSNPEALGQILTSDASVERSTVRKKVRNGQLVEVQQKAPPETVTKRVTAMVDKITGAVHLVSTYRKSRGGAYAVDPMKTKLLHRPSVPLEKLLGRYDPIFSVLLDEPVQNFHQKFDSVRDFNNKFLKPAAEREKQIASSEEVLAEQAAAAEERHRELIQSSMGTGKVAKPGVQQPEPGTLERTVGITPAESEALLYNIDYFLPEGLSEVEGIDVLLMSLQKRSEMSWLEPRDRQSISALQKAYDAIKAKWPALTDEQALAQLKDEIFYEAQKTDSAENFHQRLSERYGAEGPSDVRPQPTGEAAATQSETARELTVKPTREKLRPWERTTRTGPGPTPELPVPKDPAKLSPEELAYVEAMTEAKYGKSPERLKELTEEQQTILGIRRLAKASGKLVDDTLMEGLRVYSQWMVERLEKNGGPYAVLAAKMFNEVTSTARKLYGSLTPTLDPARRAAGKLNPATSWLHSLKNVTPNAAIARFVGAVEGTIPVPAFAQHTVNLIARANLEIGKLLMGVHATGKVQRNLNAYGVDVIRQGPGAPGKPNLAWKAMVEGNAVANGLPVADVERFFIGMKRELDRPDITQAEIEKVNQDFERVMPKAITHVKVGPLWKPIMHTDAFNYLEAAGQRASYVAAFRQQFPNTPVGRADFATLMENVRSELGGGYEIDNLTSIVRAMQGHPTDNYVASSLIGVGRPIGEGFRFLNQTVGNFFAKLVLTGQIPVQTPETFIGATPRFLGYRNYLRAMAQLKQIYPQLELNGAVNRVIMDFSFDKHSPVRSAFRIAGNAISRGFAESLMNELQEGLAAATARVVTERIQAGTLTAWEKSMLPQTFKVMGFSPAEARAMMAGSTRLLSQFERKAASFLTSGNKAMSEGSRIGANRFFNSIFRFQAYPMMKMNQHLKAWTNMVDAIKNGTAEEKAASTYLFTRNLFGDAAQGALTTGIRALMFGSAFELGIKTKEALDEPFQFAIDSTLSAIGGPLQLMWQGAREKGLMGIGHKFMDSIMPYAITKTLTDFATGSDVYRDKSTFDKVGAFLRQKIPGSKMIGMGLALTGLSQENRELDAAIRAFNRYSRDNWGTGGSGALMKEDTRKDFRIAMRQAIEALKDGNDKAFDKAMDKAEELAESKRQIKSTFRGRKLLKSPDGKELTEEQMDALRKHIGNRAVDMLEDFDAMLEAVAR